MVHAFTPVCRASNGRRRRYKSSRCGTRFHASVQGVHPMRRRHDKGSRCGSRFHPCMQGIQREATPLQEFTLWCTLPPSVQGVQHEACAWAENYAFIQKIVALHLQPHWQKLDAHLRGAAQGVHASMVHVLFNDGWYEGLAGGGTVEFGDGTKFPWSRICTWHGASDH